MEKAKYINDILVETKISLYEVTCPCCKKIFITQRHGNYKIRAIGCKYCTCGFNVEWEEIETKL